MDEWSDSAVRDAVLALETWALERWFRGDPSGFLEISAADVVCFEPGEDERIDGLPALTAHYERVRGSVKVERFELRSPRVQRVGNAAVLTFRLETFGDDAALWSCTEVFRFDAPRWRRIHAHRSRAR